MPSFASFLRIPFWLEKAWQETRVQPREPEPGLVDPQDADTVPVPLADVRAPRE